jgi:RNA polymerase sigma-70 factor, ECF subfamily
MGMRAVALEAEFESILVAAQAGGEWAIARLYREHNPGLLRFLASRAGDGGEDLAQETWMGVAHGLPNFTGDERAFRAWLFTIAHRRLVQRWRDVERRPSSPMAPEDLQAIAVGSDPGESVTARAAAAELVAGLPPEQAEVVLLRVVGGFEAAEVGEIVGKSAGAVRVLQHRALKRLAERFSKETVTP